MRKMYHLFFLFYVLFLAFQSPIIAAQTCNSTTGTYQSCCPSSDKKTLTFQGREYRVHCNYTIGSDTPVPANNTDECAQKCKNGSPYWEFYIRQPLGRGVCTCGSLFSKSQTVSFVPIDPELANDLAKCRADNKTCTDTVKDCQTKLGTCPSDLKTCQDGLRDCPTQCDKTCPGNLVQCQKDLKAASATILEKTKECPPKCRDKLKKCNTEKKNMCKCPKFKCTAAVKYIGGAKYRVHCNEFQGHHIPETEEYFRVKSMQQCATRCAQTSRCQWAQYGDDANVKGCTMNFDKWHRARTETARGDIPFLVLEKL